MSGPLGDARRALDHPPAAHYLVHMDGLDPVTLADLARRWRLREVSVFGSAARGEDGPKSDLDLLIRFDDAADWSLLDIARLKIEIEGLTHRPVDLVERAALVNPYRRRAILKDARVLYDADGP